MKDTISASFVVSHAHPAMSGHFPGEPVVPAVLILEMVADALLLREGKPSVSKITRAKFISVLRPGEEVIISLVPKSFPVLHFSCEKKDGKKIAIGEIIVGESADAPQPIA